MNLLGESLKGRFLIITNFPISNSKIRDFKPYNMNSSKVIYFYNTSIVQTKIIESIKAVTERTIAWETKTFQDQEISKELQLRWEVWLRNKIMELLNSRKPIQEGRTVNILDSEIVVDVIRNANPDRMLVEYQDLLNFSKNTREKGQKLYISLDPPTE